jgi:hypothetical protein
MVLLLGPGMIGIEKTDGSYGLENSRMDDSRAPPEERLEDSS